MPPKIQRTNSLRKRKRNKKEDVHDLEDKEDSTTATKINGTKYKKVKEDSEKKRSNKEKIEKEKQGSRTNVHIKEEKTKHISSCTLHHNEQTTVQKRIRNYEDLWEQLDIEKDELQLKYCFLIGQEFCFKEVKTDMYIGPVNKNIYSFKETESGVFYQCIYDSELGCIENKKESYKEKQERKERYEQEVRAFFNLDFPLRKNIKIWKQKDQRIKEITEKVQGLRILKTDPIECFFSFICSANNNISRTTTMIEFLKRCYGNHIAEVTFEGKDVLITLHKNCTIKNNKKLTLEKNRSNPLVTDRVKNRVKEKETNNILKKKQIKSDPYNVTTSIHHSEASVSIFPVFHYKQITEQEKVLKKFNFFEFPSLETLSNLQEEDLVSLGFGYRSSHIIKSALMLQRSEYRNWIEDFKKETKTINVINELVKFPGVGFKVANCICLFGLSRFDSIPIDTHIYDVIDKYYSNILQTITNKTKQRKSVKTIKGDKDAIENDEESTTTTPRRSIRKNKSLTKGVYMKIFKEMENIFGPNCGWAQTILFISELKKFQHIFYDSTQ